MPLLMAEVGVDRLLPPVVADVLLILDLAITVYVSTIATYLTVSVLRVFNSTEHYKFLTETLVRKAIDGDQEVKEAIANATAEVKQKMDESVVKSDSWRESGAAASGPMRAVQPSDVVAKPPR